MPYRSTLLVLLSVLAGAAAAADKQLTLVVPASDVALNIAVPLPQDVEPPAGASWQLVEANSATTVPTQMLPAMADDGSVAEGSYRLAAIIPPAKPSAESRRFLLQRIPDNPSAEQGFTLVEKDDKTLEIADRGKSVLAYNYGVITASDVPENDCRRSRSCYVHPIWGLDGEILTDDFPKDHYHHHGLFWAWPHITIAGKHHDLWSQWANGVAGSVGDIEDKHVGWIRRDAGPVSAILAVENGWFVDGRKVMIERVWLRSCAASEVARSIDLEFTWIPVDAPVTLRGSDGSYGGLSLRFAVHDPKQAAITVPSGNQPEDAGSVRFPWADLTYPFSTDGNRSGAAIFVAPSHPDHPPEWLLRHYGPLCINWPGATGKTFQPNVPIRLNYRLWIHKSAVTVDDLQKAYNAYVAAAGVHWEQPMASK